MPSTIHDRLTADKGYSLVELIVAMGLTTVVMGITLGGLANVMKGNESVMAIAALNNSVRAGMDLMVRDLLQVGSGLPASHAVTIPHGANSQTVRIPGPPNTEFFTDVDATNLPAVFPGAGTGPEIEGVDTDTITILMADNAFVDVLLSAVTDASVTIAAGPTLDSGPDRVVAGQLMMIKKGSVNTLVQVTNVDYAARRLDFADGDSLRLNQSAAESGTLKALNAEEPASDPSAMLISRIRMISYYLDISSNTDHPRLVRRINNGRAVGFSNTLGTAVATDVIDLQFTYDISNGDGNPSAIMMSPTDLTTDGACDPEACARTQIRKVNLLLTSRSPNQVASRTAFLSNTLQSQVSLRAMAFVDRYPAPEE